jgi:hypothetical protein
MPRTTALMGYELANRIAEGIRANHLNTARHIVDDLKPFDPAHPDAPEPFDVPASPGWASVTPGGT